MNQNNNKPPLGVGNFQQTFSITTVSMIVCQNYHRANNSTPYTLQKYGEEPEAMSEDSSSSSSDEGAA
jgi:hypothetical protein